MTAKQGRGDELAELMLAAAEEQREDPGCILYLLNRQADDPRHPLGHRAMGRSGGT